MRYIITGCTGWLAREIARQLKQANSNCIIVGASRSGECSCEDYNQVVSNETLTYGSFIQADDYIVHAAFCRKSKGQPLAESITFSRAVFQSAVFAQAAGIINISTQAVYGGTNGLNATEESAPSPEYLYSLAKYSSEQILEGVAGGRGYQSYTSLRMASLMGVSSNQSPTNVLSKFIENALAGKDISIVGGTQRFSFLDVEDAAACVLALLRRPADSWKHIYNVTPDAQVNIVDMGHLVANLAASHTNQPPVAVLLEETDETINAGASNAFTKEHLGWQPKSSFEDIARKMLLFRASK